jgi:hypothetical protein
MQNGGQSLMMKGLDITSSREAALTGKSRSDYVVPLRERLLNKRRLLDNLYWNGDYEKAKIVQVEVDVLEELDLKGERYYCMF